MKIDLTEKLVESVLPNNLITVDEEYPLSERIGPYVKDSQRWLESHIVGDVELPPDLEDMAIRAVIIRAFMKAIPALDLVVTPSGFGVVSSQNLVPASKERIERLIDSLSDNLYELILHLQAECVACADWRESKIGRHYCSTFIPFLRDVAYVADKNNVFNIYEKARGFAQKLEDELAQEYIGFELMGLLRQDFYKYLSKSVSKSESKSEIELPNVIATIVAGVRRYALKYVKESPSRCPDEHEVWHFADSILRLIHRNPELDMIWEATMKDKFEAEPFKNARKGGYFF